MEQTQQKAVFDFLIESNGKLSNNELRDFAYHYPMADANRRMRELVEMPTLKDFGMPNHRIITRPMTDSEMLMREYKTRVHINLLIPIEKPKPQMELYLERKEQVIIA